MTDQAVATFAQGLRGRLIRQGDEDYDAARALYNGMIDKRPQLIARPADVADVISAVNFSREHAVLLAIRGGGHNGPGLGSCDDGLVIDLSALKSVRVDPAPGTVPLTGVALVQPFARGLYTAVLTAETSGGRSSRVVQVIVD
jgi:FAD/FMN-containing dehydrogenase